MDLLIRNVNVIDTSSDFHGDIYIKDGIISEIGINIIKECDVIDGEGLTLLPAFTDLHVHFRDPGFTYKEDIESGSMAAVKGGYTTVNLMANTNPPCSTMETFHYVVDKAKAIGLVDAHQVITITKDMKGTSIEHLDDITGEVKIISDDGKGVLNNKVMYDAMMKAKEKNITVMSHVEDEELVKIDTRLSENLMTIRDIELAKYTGCSFHVAHVSTKECIEYIKWVKDNGYKNITCEVAPHHIALTDEVKYRVNPPIREKKDTEEIIKAIKEGYVDAIATDHAPHTPEDKEKGAPGMVGIETAFAVCYTHLVKAGHICLKKLSEIMSKNPSKILKVNKGEIKPGFEGDVVLIDLNKKYKIDSAEFVSKGKNTPFDGMEVYGEIVMTVKGGKIVYKK